jgi:hypothetical protein
MADQPAPSDNISFGQFTGLKNTVARERLTPTELEVAKNVDIDDVGQLRRRRGYALVSAANYHSLFTADDGTVYGVRNGNLGVIRENYTFQQVVAGVGGGRIAYVQVGPTVYFSSSDTNGKIDHATKVASPWGAADSQNTWLSPVINPVPGLPPVKGKLLGKPPLATSLAYYNGRIYMAQGRAVWATELYLYDFVDKTKTYTLYESDVQVLAAMTDGLYVGTEDAIWFQSGPFNEMRRVASVNSGALPGSVASIPPHLIPDQFMGNTRSAIMVMTHGGLCLGLDGGNMMNLTQTKVIFPEAIRVNSLFREQDGVNQYIGVADSGGSPASNARIGDYVDAEIRRFQGA